MQLVATGAGAPGPFRLRLGEPGLIELLDHWCGLRHAADGHPPSRRALDPMSVRKLLPYVEIYRLMPDGRLRCCLSGTAIRNETGRELTGQYLDEMLPKAAVASRTSLFHRALESGRPVAYRCALPIYGRDHKAVTRLLLPLLDDQGQATIVASMVVFRIAPPVLTGPMFDPAGPTESFIADEAELGSSRSTAAA